MKVNFCRPPDAWVLNVSCMESALYYYYFGLHRQVCFPCSCLMWKHELLYGNTLFVFAFLTVCPLRCCREISPRLRKVLAAFCHMNETSSSFTFFELQTCRFRWRIITDQISCFKVTVKQLIDLAYLPYFPATPKIAKEDMLFWINRVTKKMKL